MNLPKLAISDVFKWAAGIGSIIAIIVAMVWGVPSYLEAQVGDLYAEEVAAAGPSQEVKTLIAKMEAVEAGQLRVEGRVDALSVQVNDFSIRFMDYLDRQIERNQ